MTRFSVILAHETHHELGHSEGKTTLTGIHAAKVPLIQAETI